MSGTVNVAHPGVLRAVGMDALSLGFLAAAATAAYLDRFWTTLGLALVSVVSAFLGATWTEAVLRRRVAGSRRGVVLVAARVVKALIVPIGIAVLLLAPSWRPNPAVVAARPLVEIIEQAGGQQICSVEDSGRPGPSDNRQPLFAGIYTAPTDQGQLEQRMLDAAHQRGYDTSHGAGGDYVQGDSARLGLRTGLGEVQGGCGDLDETQKPATGRQLISLRLVYSSSYWTNHGP